ncbi:MAG: hypothetical protein M3071_23325 [Actinomycetota bacterium]|nr:hypothetical protein [Actinomycetota bacterium]
MSVNMVSGRGELINELLRTPPIRRCTSYIVLSRHVPPRTAPLVAAAGERAGRSARALRADQ